MARRSGISIQNNFIQGLITETTALKFPENACTETFNCVFNEKGRVTRRPSLDIEQGYSTYTATKDSGEVFQEYLWQAVSGSGTLAFLVVQQGSNLFFYDVSSTTNGTSARKKSFTVDLDTYLAASGTLNPAIIPCSFASGRGDLIVSNQACDPIAISYNDSTDNLTVTEITLKQRDFVGLNDGLGLTERPTESVVTLRTNNGEHYYNLLNQGWHQGNDNTTDAAIHQWDSARTDMPSNADYPALYRASTTDAFDNARVLSLTPGNRPAPKGHFILDVANPNRLTAITSDGWTSCTFDSATITVDRTAGTNIGSPYTNLSNAFNGNTGGSGCYTTYTANNWIGKTYSTNIVSATISAMPSGSTDVGFHFSSGGLLSSAIVTDTITAKLYGKTGAAPTSATDGTLLGTTVFTNSTSIEKTITSSDTSTVWDHVWVNLTASTTSGSIGLRELTFFAGEASGTGTGGETAYVRPGVNAFYAGRVWYAGLNSDGYNNSLFFSQIIENTDQYGKCYQVNDPTAEDFYDLLPSDGGVIKIPEMANVVKLHVYQKALLVFATNGIWLIRGSSSSQFSATDYTVSKLSSLGTQSPMSFIDVKGLPMWWGEDGILMVEYNPQFDSYSVKSLSDETIKSFFLEIPARNRMYVKGAYDVQNQVAYWIYNSDEDATDLTVYNACLCFNARSGAFYPWTWENTTPTVRGIVYVQDSIGTSTPKIKLTTTSSLGDTTEYLYFSELYSDQYSDWSTYATDFSTASDESDYTSYFITGYKLDGETQKFFQPNYLFVFSDYLADSSVYVQAIYDFTNTGNSGKWSTRQQGYNSGINYRDVVVRRLKVRGKGRSLQFKFISESGKPFSIIGWSCNESTNGGI